MKIASNAPSLFFSFYMRRRSDHQAINELERPFFLVSILSSSFDALPVASRGLSSLAFSGSPSSSWVGCCALRASLSHTHTRDRTYPHECVQLPTRADYTYFAGLPTSAGSFTAWSLGCNREQRIASPLPSLSRRISLFFFVSNFLSYT